MVIRSSSAWLSMRRSAGSALASTSSRPVTSARMMQFYVDGDTPLAYPLDEERRLRQSTSSRRPAPEMVRSEPAAVRLPLADLDVAHDDSGTTQTNDREQRQA